MERNTRMTVKQLIEVLSKLPQTCNVMINNGGCLQDASCPYKATIDDDDEEESGDCDGRVGEQVVVITCAS